MWLIDRQTDGRAGSRRIPLPAVLQEALIRWYIGAGSRDDEAAGITLVQQARIGGKWIACNCLGHASLPPILTPAYLSEAETYYLRRLTQTNRPEHRSDCPFFRDSATNRITHVRNHSDPVDPPTGFFEVLRPAPDKLAQRPERELTDDRTRNASIPRLARLLWRLIDASGVNRLPPLAETARDHSIAREFRALGRSAGQIEIAPGIELGRLFWTHAGALHGKQVYAALRRLAETWPTGHAPQAFLALFADKFEGNVVSAAGAEPVHLANRVQSPSVLTNRIAGPYLVLVVVGQYPESRGYSPLRAYAQPILSGRRFVPVASEFERTILQELLRVQYSLRRYHIEFAVEKPVFDRLTQSGSCRPDFLIEARSMKTGEVRELVLEARGPDASDPAPISAPASPAHDRSVLRLTPQNWEDAPLSEKLLNALHL
ncbi:MULTISPECIES: hypothetical protein [unclassified Sphingobium]|uniref:hypothetical protein n=1 Tax=unclassified Sphingobium TaxID=2611147 RepID=UPI0005CC76A2|nr:MULTISPECIES: hypothetical protein [unclassified Sphingobium]AJR26922.1 hypothetical protein TZ53_24310 [Sphingobium sp. YBL2]QPI75413.1 hypothetical protein IZV00_19890 [Sphingobium sp. Cam5-1]